MTPKTRMSSVPFPSGSDEHGPLRAERIPAADYTSDFLHGLKVRREVVPVRDDWDGDNSRFPPHVTWVIYPNGDLERVGFA